MEEADHKNCWFPVLLPTHQNWPYPQILWPLSVWGNDTPIT